MERVGGTVHIGSDNLTESTLSSHNSINSCFCKDLYYYEFYTRILISTCSGEHHHLLATKNQSFFVDGAKYYRNCEKLQGWETTATSSILYQHILIF